MRRKIRYMEADKNYYRKKQLKTELIIILLEKENSW